MPQGRTEDLKYARRDVRLNIYIRCRVLSAASACHTRSHRCSTTNKVSSIILFSLARPKPETSPLVLKARFSSSLTTTAFLLSCTLYPRQHLNWITACAERDNPACNLEPQGPTHQSSIRSAMRASSMVLNRENALRGPGSERSPQSGGTVIRHKTLGEPEPRRSSRNARTVAMLRHTVCRTDIL
jgi:hypothetical protein